jgi:leucyl aminopeptidase
MAGTDRNRRQPLEPETLAREARDLAKRVGLIIKVLDMEGARRKGLGAFFGGAQGSARPGRVIILQYKGAGPKARPLALIGKAITFDSGGISLKGAEFMDGMKTDMSGGAVVLAAVSGAARLGLRLNLTAVIPAAENMPDGAALRPGDVLTTLSGQTVEINSTDAEGRLVLADALTLAREYNPSGLIDLATLTGACVVALGKQCAGMMGTGTELMDGLRAASAASGERVWELPLFDDYFEILKSETADFRNSAGRYAGAITGGLFLKRFAGMRPGSIWTSPARPVGQGRAGHPGRRHRLRRPVAAQISARSLSGGHANRSKNTLTMYRFFSNFMCPTLQATVRKWDKPRRSGAFRFLMEPEAGRQRHRILL